jgi:AP-1 complex subunit mu
MHTMYEYVCMHHKVVMVTKYNTNVVMLLSYIHGLINVFKYYFKEVEEESIKDNFVVVYELLDEMMDFGYPQSTEPKILKEFIKAESHTLKIDTKTLMDALGVGVGGAGGLNLQNLVGGISQLASNIGNQLTMNESEDTSGKVTIPKAFTQTVSWRAEGIRYKKNEVFLDVIESVNILVGNNGTTLRSEICGVLKMKTYLSGMPELKLGLNDKVLFENMGRNVSKGRAVDLEDVKFHQCVRLNRFEAERTINFVPPDGEFDLMSYRLSTRVKPLIIVSCVPYVHSNTRIEYTVRAKSQFKKKSTAQHVEIFIPVPKDTYSPTFKPSIGSAEYVPEKDAVKWLIRQFQGGKEYMCSFEINLPSVSSEESIAQARKRPISLNFEIPYFTVSGLQVRYLKIIEKTGVNALPWVRYITRSGEYIVRQ